MRPRILFSAFATAAILGLAAHPADAQRSRVTTPRPVRALATYEFGTSPRATAFPRTVTVSDSAGTLVARAALPGSGEAIPMTVTVLESDLVLQAETPNGVLTLVLDKQNDGGVPALATGRWMLGQSEGKLRGRIRS